MFCAFFKLRVDQWMGLSMRNKGLPDLVFGTLCQFCFFFDMFIFALACII